MKIIVNILIILAIPLLTKSQQIELDIDPYTLLFFCSDKRDSVEKPIVPEWIDKDVTILNTQINILPKIANTVTGILKILPRFLDGEGDFYSRTFDLGFNLNSTQHTIYGGYGSYLIDVLYFEDKVIKLRITIQNHIEIIEEYLQEVSKLTFHCIDGHIIYEKVYDQNLKYYTQHNGKLYIASNDSIQQRKRAINYFMDIYNGGEFQTPFYFANALGSETFNYIRYFIVNKDTEALEQVLFSPSPTSRLFAARTLIYMKKNFTYISNITTSNRIQNTIRNAQKISSGTVSCHLGQFDYDYYDIVEDFEQLLKEQ